MTVTRSTLFGSTTATTSPRPMPNSTSGGHAAYLRGEGCVVELSAAVGKAPPSGV